MNTQFLKEHIQIDKEIADPHIRIFFNILLWAVIDNHLEFGNEMTLNTYLSVLAKSDKFLRSNLANILSSALPQYSGLTEISSMQLPIPKST